MILDFSDLDFDTLYNIEIGQEACDNRIDSFLSYNMPKVSRTYIQKLIKNNNIMVNAKSVKANYRLNAGDIVDFTIPSPKLPDIKPENIPLDIIFEDDDIIIVNKPKNMVVHPAPGHYSGTLVNALMYHCRDNLSGINGVLRPGIVHRIDKDTTGLIIACKNDTSHIFISEQLAAHDIKREYHALVYGKLLEQNGSVDKNIGRNKNDRKKMAITTEGKRAVTHYRLLNTYNYKNQEYSYIECNLETGRTHQIRVHMSSIGHPLVGDEVYSNRKHPFNTNGQMLHAKTLGIVHPTTKKYLEFDSEIPEYFGRILGIMNTKNL